MRLVIFQASGPEQLFANGSYRPVLLKKSASNATVEKFAPEIEIGVLGKPTFQQNRPKAAPLIANRSTMLAPAVVPSATDSTVKGIAMTIDQISLPKGVGPHATKLLDAITGAATHEELNRAGGKAEGFVLGLESTKAIKSQIAESLYVAYDDAAAHRASELKG